MENELICVYFGVATLQKLGNGVEILMGGKELKWLAHLHFIKFLTVLNIIINEYLKQIGMFTIFPKVRPIV